MISVGTISSMGTAEFTRGMVIAQNTIFQKTPRVVVKISTAKRPHEEMIIIDDIISLLASLASVGEMCLKEAIESGRLDYAKVQKIRQAVLADDTDTLSIIVDRLRIKAGSHPGEQSGGADLQR